MSATTQQERTAVTSRDPFDGLPLLITVARAAALLGVSRSAAYRCATGGDLPIRRLGGRIYVVTAGLRVLLETAPQHGEVG